MIPRHLNWSDFNYSKVAIPACDTMSPKQIERLAKETSNIIAEKKPLSFFELIRLVNTRPKSIIRAFKEPSKALSLIKRLRI